MEKKELTFEQELNNVLKEVEEFLTPEEKESLFKHALELVQEDKKIKELDNKIDLLEDTLEKAIETFNNKVDEQEKHIDDFNDQLTAVQHRVMKECCDTVKPLNENENDISKLNTSELNDFLTEFLKGMLE